MKEDEDKIFNLIANKEDEASIKPFLICDKKNNIISVEDVLSSEFSSDVDSDLPLNTISNDYKSMKPKKLSNSLKMLKLTDQEDQKNSELLHTLIPFESQNPYTLEQENLLSIKSNQLKSFTIPEQLPKNNIKLLKHRLHKQVSATQLEENNLTESSDDDYYTKNQQQSPKIQTKKLLIDFTDDQYQSILTDCPEKQTRRVERVETVIYKNLKENKEKNLLDLSNNESLSIPPPLPPSIINHPPSNPSSLDNTDVNHLQVPSVNLKDIIFKSPYPASEASFAENTQVAEMLNKKYRQSCMLDLIKIIDAKMFAHHHSHTESTRHRKHLTITRKTPSPDSIHRKMLYYHRSRSRSPDKSSISHRHHGLHSTHTSCTSIHNLSKYSLKNHHSSCECIMDKHYHPCFESDLQHLPDKVEESVVISAAKTLAQPKPAFNELIDKNEFVEMQALKMSDNSNIIKPRIMSENITTINANSTISNTVPTTITTITNVSDTKPTNIANATDNLCVSHSPSIRRQQHQQNLNQEIQQQSISPCGNQQHTKAAHSPASKNSSIPLHRRSSDSDLSITPKGRYLPFMY
jgi:hypothetical protein